MLQKNQSHLYYWSLKTINSLSKISFKYLIWRCHVGGIVEKNGTASTNRYYYGMSWLGLGCEAAYINNHYNEPVVLKSDICIIFLKENDTSIETGYFQAGIMDTSGHGKII